MSCVARSKRPGWEARWGPEEVERTSSGVPAVDVGRMEAMASAATTVNPSHAGKSTRPPSRCATVLYHRLTRMYSRVCPCLRCHSLLGVSWPISSYHSLPLRFSFLFSAGIFPPTDALDEARIYHSGGNYTCNNHIFCDIVTLQPIYFSIPFLE